MPMSAAIRLASELNEAEVMKDVPRAAEIRDELATLANAHLNDEQKVQLHRVTAAIGGETAPQSFEERRTDKMLRNTDKNVKTKAAV